MGALRPHSKLCLYNAQEICETRLHIFDTWHESDIYLNVSALPYVSKYSKSLMLPLTLRLLHNPAINYQNTTDDLIGSLHE